MYIFICKDNYTCGRKYMIFSLLFTITSDTVHIIKSCFMLPKTSYKIHLRTVLIANLYCDDKCSGMTARPSSVTVHYSDGIMGTIASQITSVVIVYSTVYSDANQRNIKALRHWPLCGEFTGDWWIRRTKPVARKMFLFDDVIIVVLLVNLPAYE